MSNESNKGLTLVELLISITIMTILAATAIPLLSTSLDVYSQGSEKSQLYQEGLHAMERMTTSVRKSTFLMIPNAHSPTRDILALSGLINDDNDFYFNDGIFPRIDEDPKKQMTDDGQSGIAGVDDDGDALIDESGMNDDDEDGLDGEDQLDGIDNDGDGNVDEDTHDDANVAGMDDDADGSIDEGDNKDDDEDGVVNEDPLNSIMYLYDSGTNTLTESIPSMGESTDLSTHVTKFEVKYASPGLIEINLELTSNEGEKIEFKEYAYARNTYQRMGKKVR